MTAQPQCIPVNPPVAGARVLARCAYKVDDGSGVQVRRGWGCVDAGWLHVLDDADETKTWHSWPRHRVFYVAWRPPS